MKPTPKPKKKLTYTQIKTKVWDEFSLFIRLRDALAWQEQHPEYNGVPGAPCITCKRWYPAIGVGCYQAGHFIPGRNNKVLFDEVQVNGQCDSCNRHKKGNWPNYYDVMVERHGIEAVEKMRNERNEEVIYTIPDLEEMLALYKSKVKDLKEALGI